MLMDANRSPNELTEPMREVRAIGAKLSRTDALFSPSQRLCVQRREGRLLYATRPARSSEYLCTSKLDGEPGEAAWARTIVVRSGYIFGTRGPKFPQHFMRARVRGEQLNVINDSFGTPIRKAPCSRPFMNWRAGICPVSITRQRRRRRQL